MKVRKKILEVEAFQYNASNPSLLTDALTTSVPEWFLSAVSAGDIEEGTTSSDKKILMIHDRVNFHGVLFVHNTDWVIRGIKGELYPCTDDVFKETYEEIV